MWNEIIFVHEIESHLHTRCTGKIIISGIWNVLKRSYFFHFDLLCRYVCLLYIFIVFFLFVFVDSKLLSLFILPKRTKKPCSFCIHRLVNEKKRKKCWDAKRIELMMNWALKYRRDTLINFDKREKYRTCIHTWTARAGGSDRADEKQTEMSASICKGNQIRWTNPCVKI